MLDRGEGAEQKLSNVRESDSAARGDAVLHEEDGGLGEEIVDASGGAEAGKQTSESRGKIFVGGEKLTGRVAEAEAGSLVQDGKTTASAVGGEVTATVLVFCRGIGGRRSPGGFGFASLPGFWRCRYGIRG